MVPENHVAMEEEEDDDIYAPNEAIEFPVQPITASNGASKKGKDLEEGEEEGEEIEEDDSESDIDIITESKQIDKSEPLQSQRTNVKKASAPAHSSEPPDKSRPLAVSKSDKLIKPPPSQPGASYPAYKTSKLDVDAKPIYEPNGKPITEIDMDADFSDDDKPWRRPGTDMTDYFNYGFDEFTWASYCLKQDSLRKEVVDSKKQMDEMQNLLGISGKPGTAPPAITPMGALTEIPLDMQQMMAQMMSSGVDPTQMDPSVFIQQMMQGGQTGSAAGQTSNFGTQNFGQQTQNQQQIGFGYGAAGGGGSSSGGGGRNQGGRGQSRRNW